MSATDRIELRGLGLVAVVGVLPEERTRAQPLRADLVVEVDLAAAGRSDDLSDTVDYSAICDAVTGAGLAEAPQLLERMAERMAEAVLGCDRRILAVELRLAKKRPPVAHALEDAAVWIRRAAGGPGGS
ncbi:MAG: dihydroneopterin aldolase [Microthrixaceae bacterium]